MSAATPPTAPPDTVRGITIRQPWATCILAGKDVENRSAPWGWRGWLLLHAAKTTERAALRDPLVGRTIRGRTLETGAVIGVVRLTDCHRCPDHGPQCSPWAQRGAHHLVLADVHAVPLPVPATGALGPWRPSAELLERVLLQLPDLPELGGTP